MTIVKAAHDYKDRPWLAYDVHFRTLAATMAAPVLGPGGPIPVVPAFQLAARQATPSWSTHTTRPTQRTDRGQIEGPRRSKPPAGATIKKGKERAVPYQAARTFICWKYSTNVCHSTMCSYRHICLSCHGSHPEVRYPGAEMSSKDTLSNLALDKRMKVAKTSMREALMFHSFWKRLTHVWR